MASSNKEADGMTAINKVRIVCVSDSHNHAPGQGYTLPPGDILIHAGDLTNQGSLAEIQQAVKWLESTNFPVKLVIAGNHDLGLDKQYHLKHKVGWTVEADNVDACRSLLRDHSNITYLEHESCEVAIKGRRLRIYGSPFSIDHGKQNWAFQYTPEYADEIWKAIPEDTDILVTHTPPRSLVDESMHWTLGGCPTLAERLKQIKPLLHVCGHHHEGRGAELVSWSGDLDQSRSAWVDPGVGNKKQSLLTISMPAQSRTAVVNASIVKHSFKRGQAKQFNKPIVVDLVWPKTEASN